MDLVASRYQLLKGPRKARELNQPLNGIIFPSSKKVNTGAPSVVRGVPLSLKMKGKQNGTCAVKIPAI